MAVIVTLAEKIGILNDITDTGERWDGADVGLFVNDVIPDQNTVVADLTQPTWTGYAQQAVTWQQATASPAGLATVPATSVFFLTGANANALVYGAFVVNSGGDLIYAERFDTPIAAVGVTSITYVPKVDLGNLA